MEAHGSDGIVESEVELKDFRESVANQSEVGAFTDCLARVWGRDWRFSDSDAGI